MEQIIFEEEDADIEGSRRKTSRMREEAEW